MSETLTPNDIRLATKWEKENPDLFPTATTLDYQVRNRDSNGLGAAGAILLINGQIYIHVPKYLSVMAAKVA